MKLTINLATRRYVNFRLLNGWLAAGFLTFGALFLYQLREAALRQGELARVKGLVAASERGSAGPAVSPAQLKKLDDGIRFANGLIDRKAVNWLKLLDSLEEVVPGGVTLSQIEPPLGNQPLRIAGVARTFPDLRALLENMERSPAFADVFLLNQAEAKVGLTQQGITFTASCRVTRR